jgi:hypothetical protein
MTFWYIHFKTKNSTFFGRSPLQLPISVRNSRKGAFSAGEVVNLPGRIPTLQVRAEESILSALASDLNAHYCLGIDQEVIVMRGTCASPNSNQVGRLAIIGSSHTRRMLASDGSGQFSSLKTCRAGHRQRQP